METLWTRDPSVLVDLQYILNIWPSMCQTTPSRLNAFTRALILASGLSYYLAPGSRYWMIGLSILLYMYTASDKLEETFDLDAVVARAKSTVDQVNTAKPDPSSVDESRNAKAREWEDLASKAARGAKIKATYLTDVLNDDDKVARNFTRNPRESTSRAEVMWTKDQRIYSNRNFIRPGTDNFDSLFENDAGFSGRYLSRRA